MNVKDRVAEWNDRMIARLTLQQLCIETSADLVTNEADVRIKWGMPRWTDSQVSRLTHEAPLY